MPTIWCPRTSGSFGLCQLAVDDVQVGAADAAGLDLDQHLPGPGLGLGDVNEPQRLARGFEDHGAHRLSSQSSRRALAQSPASAAAARSRSSVFSRPSSSIDSNRLGETFVPVTATRIDWKALRGLSPSDSASERSACSIASVSNGSSVGECRLGRLEHPGVEQLRVGRHVAEEKACIFRIAVEPDELLLHDRHRAPHQLRVPVEPLLAEEGRERGGVGVGLERAQVDAVHPLQLLVVEGRRAAGDALDREALDQFLRAT